MAANQEATLGP